MKLEHWTEYRLREIDDKAETMNNIRDLIDDDIYQTLGRRIDGILMSTTYEEGGN